jgi:hypothetical protein
MEVVVEISRPFKLNCCRRPYSCLTQADVIASSLTIGTDILHVSADTVANITKFWFNVSL